MHEDTSHGARTPVPGSSVDTSVESDFPTPVGHPAPEAVVADGGDAGRAIVWMRIACHRLDNGELVGSGEAVERAVVFARRTDDPGLLCQCLAERGRVATRCGDEVLAAQALTEAVRVATRLEDSRARATTARSLGDAWDRLGDHERALGCFRDAHASFRSCEATDAERSDVLCRLGEAHLALRSVQEALHAFERALVLLDARDAARTARLQYGIGRALIALGDLSRARACLRSAGRQFHALRQPRSLLRVRHALAKARLTVESDVAAVPELEAVLAEAECLGLTCVATDCAERLSTWSASQGRWEDAYMYARRSVSTPTAQSTRPVREAERMPTALGGQRSGVTAGRVLVVDDLAVIRRTTVRLLTMMGMEPRAVADGRQAIAAVRSEPFDLVLMDCHMPGFDGFRATRAIRESELGSRRLPIVALTADDTAEARSRCVRSGMDDLMLKPPTLEDLRLVVARWLTKQR